MCLGLGSPGQVAFGHQVWPVAPNIVTHPGYFQNSLSLDTQNNCAQQIQVALSAARRESKIEDVAFYALFLTKLCLKHKASQYASNENGKGGLPLVDFSSSRPLDSSLFFALFSALFSKVLRFVACPTNTAESYVWCITACDCAMLHCCLFLSFSSLSLLFPFFFVAILGGPLQPTVVFLKPTDKVGLYWGPSRRIKRKEKQKKASHLFK